MAYSDKVLEHSECYVVNNFITNHQCTEIINWIDNNKQYFIPAGHPGAKRITTRFVDTHIIYPETIISIRKKIIKYFNLCNYIYPQTFPDGIVLSVGFPGDELEAHKDPRYFPDRTTYHFNILLSQPKLGGDVIVENKIIKLNQCDLMFYPVSELEHSTTLLQGDVFRYLLIFGFCLKDPVKIHCSVLAEDTIKADITNYKKII
jgi:hypothetical protein